jgi:hypothetical protein
MAAKVKECLLSAMALKRQQLSASVRAAIGFGKNGETRTDLWLGAFELRYFCNKHKRKVDFLIVRAGSFMGAHRGESRALRDLSSPFPL